jgi:hypothetical protein
VSFFLLFFFLEAKLLGPISMDILFALHIKKEKNKIRSSAAKNNACQLKIK